MTSEAGLLEFLSALAQIHGVVAGLSVAAFLVALPGYSSRLMNLNAALYNSARPYLAGSLTRVLDNYRSPGMLTAIEEVLEREKPTMSDEELKVFTHLKAEIKALTSDRRIFAQVSVSLAAILLLPTAVLLVVMLVADQIADQLELEIMALVVASSLISLSFFFYFLYHFLRTN